MYVIASSGHCVINGLAQVKVFESRGDAQAMLDDLVALRGERGFEVQAVHFVKEGDQ